MGGVRDVQQEVCMQRLLQGRMEGGDEVVREPREEPHRVREERCAAIRELPLSCASVESREEQIGGELASPRQPVQQRGLPRVRVADEPDGVLVVAGADLACS